jgi:plasmid stabilization system protein ParE
MQDKPYQKAEKEIELTPEQEASLDRLIDILRRRRVEQAAEREAEAEKAAAPDAPPTEQ